MRQYMEKKGLQFSLLRLAPLLILLPAIYFLLADKWGDQRPPQRLPIGKMASDFQVNADNVYTKQSFRLESLRGYPILLHFWATWCGPCLEELPTLLEQARALRKEGFSIVAVAEDKDWKSVERFFLQNPQLTEMKNLMVILLDPENKIAMQYDSQQFPETFLINQNFLVDNKFVGAQNWKHEEMQSYLQRLKSPPVHKEAP